MEKLELKHLAPYLPYSLKVIMEGKKTNIAWMSTKNIAVIRPSGIGDYKKISWKYAHLNIKPILRPLLDLTIDIEINGNYYLGLDEFSDREWALYNESGKDIIQILQYDCIIELIKRHFDVFGLIEKGLAININELTV